MAILDPMGRNIQRASSLQLLPAANQILVLTVPADSSRELIAGFVAMGQLLPDTSRMVVLKEGTTLDTLSDEQLRHLGLGRINV